MDSSILELSFIQLGLAYIFVLITLVIIRKRKLNREKELLISTIRMTIQLILTGYVLVYIFDNVSMLYTICIIILMECFAIYTIFKQSKHPLSSKLKKIIAFSMSIGTLSSLFYFLIIVVRISPWYDPRYFIPIAGMLIGNSLTGISLGISTLIKGMTTQKDKVETALMLGATPKQASKEFIDSAFDSAILPTINSMLGMGIIFLPGMMTGQILSGTSPVVAIRYQIAIMLGILGSVSFTTILSLSLGYKTFFNSNKQLDY